LLWLLSAALLSGLMADAEVDLGGGAALLSGLMADAEEDLGASAALLSGLMADEDVDLGGGRCRSVGKADTRLAALVAVRLVDLAATCPV
jgi:hypothetical protein